MACGTSFHDTFNALGDNWWKQLFDGRLHSHGPLVFDEGLHKGHVEPGYYNSIQNAHEYAYSQLGKPLTLEVYKTIHSIACAHFIEVSRSNRNVDDENINKFREKICRCTVDAKNFVFELEDRGSKIRRNKYYRMMFKIKWILFYQCNYKANLLLKDELAAIPLGLKVKVLEEITTEYTESDLASIDLKDLLKNGNPYLAKVLEDKQKVETEQEQIRDELGLTKPLIDSVWMDYFSPTIRVFYLYADPVEIEEITIKLIDNYNKQLSALPPDPTLRNQSENDIALKSIAALFQRLEWLHPFYDGQGRTDLVLLSKLLVENGFTPTILYEPYVSTFVPLEEWICYLKKGMRAWEEEHMALVNN